MIYVRLTCDRDGCEAVCEMPWPEHEYAGVSGGVYGVVLDGSIDGADGWKSSPETPYRYKGQQIYCPEHAR